MAYALDLQKCAEWLLRNQNQSNGGWGLAPGYPSSIVNTAEATFVLRRAGRSFQKHCEKGEEFIQRNLLAHFDTLGSRTRYAAFAIVALSDSSNTEIKNVIEICRDWLLVARNSDGGWGHEKQDSSSSLWSTYLAIWALQLAGADAEQLDQSYRWILSAASSRGWGFNLKSEATPVATAYGILALLNSPYNNHDNVTRGKDLLLQTTQWGIVEENIPGAVWRHCTYPWVIRALAGMRQDIFAPVFASGIKYINQLRDGGGGWRESAEHEALTIRSQFWAVLAFDSLKDAFDPENHIPIIDGERAAMSLVGPDFVQIWVRSSWAAVMPAKLYKVLVYFMLVSSFALLLGVHRAYHFPQRADSGLALILLGLSALFIRKRRRHFSKLYRAVVIITAILATLNLTVGTTVLDILESIRVFLQEHVHWT